ncbi:MAG: hypothetical protein AAGA11_08485 [Pseudomonadota bacterium]
MRRPPTHNGRELELMLSGSKPLALFGDALCCLPDECIVPEVAFAPHVASGAIVRSAVEYRSSVLARDGGFPLMREVLFALHEEAWRIPAMQLLLHTHRRTGVWNETCERTQGALLGYTDHENDLWCRWLATREAHPYG